MGFIDVLRAIIRHGADAEPRVALRGADDPRVTRLWGPVERNTSDDEPDFLGDPAGSAVEETESPEERDREDLGTNS